MATADPYQDLDPRLARALRELRSELDDRLAALRAELGVAPDSAPARAAAPDYGALLEVVRRLDAADDQSELLGRMLEGAGRFAGRSLFLLVRNGEVEGWGGFGFTAETASEVRKEISTLDPLARCVERREPASLTADQCRSLLGTQGGEVELAEGLLVPFTLRGRVAAVLYTDRTSEQELTAPALQLLAYTTANSLETLPLRRQAPEPPASAATVEVDTRELLPEAELEAEPEPVSEPEPAAEEAAPAHTVEPDAEAEISDEGEGGEEPGTEADAADEDGAGEATEEEPEPEADRSEEATPAADPLQTMAIPRTTVEVTEPPAAEKAPTATAPPPASVPSPPPRRESVPGVDDLGDRGDGIEVAPPPDLEGPGWAFRERQPSADEGRHEEARRLARLLVTEIKLYNEEQVEEGLERGDLYATLQEEIDRSQRIFEERIPAEVRAETDYFREELVRILADGDSSVLGRGR